MTDYKILEVTTSYREDIVPNTSNELVSSTVDCYLVVHCSYEYGAEGSYGTVDYDVYKIATKKYDSDGNITLTPGTGEIPTYDNIEATLKEIIEEKIKSDTNEVIYKALIRKATGVAETTINRYFEDNESFPYYD